MLPRLSGTRAYAFSTFSEQGKFLIKYLDYARAKGQNPGFTGQSVFRTGASLT
jgi:hypothetical protein